jgi:hypothetical protein
VANYMGMEGNAHMQLAPAGAQWKYSLSIQSSLASLSQVTMFEENGGQWRPVSGSDNSSVLIKKVVKNAQYDWDKGVATWSGNVKPDRAGPVELKPGDLDAMLVNLALARDVAAGKPLRLSDGRRWACEGHGLYGGREGVDHGRREGAAGHEGGAHGREQADVGVDRRRDACACADPAAEGWAG